MMPYYEKDGITLYHGDCREVLATLPANSVDSIVTDPPYGLKFMGKRWDCDVPAVEVWQECLRVLKPGGHLLAFAGTRTQHRMACRIEDAGFEIRDMIAWVYGSGFPKSLDVSTAIDKAAGAQREVVGLNPTYRRDQINAPSFTLQRNPNITAPATDAARQWQGWGTALKPALEPITVARKPLIGTVAENVLDYGTGAINIDDCRVDYQDNADMAAATPQGKCTAKSGSLAGGMQRDGNRSEFNRPEQKGRFPANLIHDGSDEVVGLMPGDEARFFYCAKADKQDRNAGCGRLPRRAAAECVEREPGTDGMESPRAGAGRTGGARNFHPTVKPTDLMRYLCRLVTPPGGLVLDPFMGSGSTGRGAVLERFRFLGIELTPEYLPIAEARIRDAAAQKVLPLAVTPQRIPITAGPGLFEVNE